MSTDTRHFLTKSIEQRTLETLERIEELLTKLVRSKALDALAEQDAETMDTRAPKRTPESPDAIKDPDGHTVGYKRKRK